MPANASEWGCDIGKGDDFMANTSAVYYSVDTVNDLRAKQMLYFRISIN